MVFYFTTPNWIKQHYHPLHPHMPLPEEDIMKLRHDLKKIQTDKPLVSIGVIAYNEEEMILSCLSSLAAQQCSFPFEIIVSNNNSVDRTEEILEKTGVRHVVEKRQGVGWARQSAMEMANGTYYLNADGDVMYPPGWAEALVQALMKPGVSSVYSVDSYIPDTDRTRMGLLFYELSRDLSHFFKGFKRPELNVGGGSFGFRLAEGKQIGWRTDIKRGEDGSMAFSLKASGKIVLVKGKKARIWSTTRSLQGQGNLFTLVIKRMKKEMKRVKEYFQPAKEGYHDRESNLINQDNPPASQENKSKQ